MLIGNSVSISNGQPSATIYDWNLGMGLTVNGERLSLEVSNRLLVSKFCEKVTKSLYDNPSDIVGIVSASEQPSVAALLEAEYQNLETLSVQFSCKFLEIQWTAEILTVSQQ